MNVGLLVMRYAFPCAEISVRTGNITQEEYDAMEAALLVGEALPRSRLEVFFPELTRRLKEVSAKEGIAEYWSEDAVHAYFLKYHDEYIDAGDGMLGRMSPTEKELCRCKVGEVVEVKEKPKILKLRIKGKEELVLGEYLGDVAVGDYVVVHRKFATEKLSPETAAAFR